MKDYNDMTISELKDLQDEISDIITTKVVETSMPEQIENPDFSRVVAEVTDVLREALNDPYILEDFSTINSICFRVYETIYGEGIEEWIDDLYNSFLD